MHPLDALRESIRQNLTETNLRDYDNNYFTDLMDQIIAVSTIKYPPQVLQEEADRVLHSWNTTWKIARWIFRLI